MAAYEIRDFSLSIEKYFTSEYFSAELLVDLRTLPVVMLTQEARGPAR